MQQGSTISGGFEVSFLTSDDDVSADKLKSEFRHVMNDATKSEIKLRASRRQDAMKSAMKRLAWTGVPVG